MTCSSVCCLNVTSDVRQTCAIAYSSDVDLRFHFCNILLFLFDCVPFLTAILPGLCVSFLTAILPWSTRRSCRWKLILKCGSRLVATGRNAWTDEKQSRAEAERRERLEERRSEKRKSQKKEDADARKGRKVAKHCVFRMIWGSGMSKNRLAKAAGAEPAGQMRDEKVHAVVAQST